MVEREKREKGIEVVGRRKKWGVGGATLLETESEGRKVYKMVLCTFKSTAKKINTQR